MGGCRFQSCDAKKRVDRDTAEITPSLDQVVTQWMSPENADPGSAWISSQVQVVGWATRPSTENDHDARSGCGVTSAFSTGHWSSCVILTWRETRISSGLPTTKESSCRLCHVNSLLRKYDFRYLETHFSYGAGYSRVTPRCWVAAQSGRPLTSSPGPRYHHLGEPSRAPSTPPPSSMIPVSEARQFVLSACQSSPPDGWR